MKNKKLLNIFITVFIIFNLLGNVFAAGSGSISASPSGATKTVNQEFDISVRVSANTNFTTFKSNVSLTNLTVVGFTLNASNILWISQPSAGSLNFNGAVKGSTGVSSLTVYTIRVKAPSAGTARISFSNGRLIGTNPVEDLGVGYTTGTYTITTPPPTATPRPRATSLPVPTNTPAPATVTTSIEITSTPSITATLSPAQQTTIQIVSADNLPLSNTTVLIDNTSYLTDNSGNITTQGLSSGNHSIKYVLNGKEYNQSFILGAYTGGKELIISILQIKDNTNQFTLGSVLIVSGIIIIINILIWFVYIKTRPVIQSH